MNIRKFKTDGGGHRSRDFLSKAQSGESSWKKDAA